MPAPFNGHSMVEPLRRVLVCSPRTAGWNQPERLARWHDLGFRHAPDFAQAQAQHEALCRELAAAGAKLFRKHSFLNGLEIRWPAAEDADGFSSEFPLAVAAAHQNGRSSSPSH